MKKKIFCILKIALKKGVGSGSTRQSYRTGMEYGSEDPDPHQNVTNPQHWLQYICCAI
jgi:hypothetical protein